METLDRAMNIIKTKGFINYYGESWGHALKTVVMNTDNT